jgi:hypothetical protein
MSTALLAILGLGAPGLGLLAARWLIDEDPLRSIDRHREALHLLGDLTARNGRRS